MKIRLPGSRRRERASAVLIVLCVLLLMAAFLAGTGQTVAHLRRELAGVEKHQLQVARTNHVSNSRPHAPPASPTNR